MHLLGEERECCSSMPTTVDTLFTPSHYVLALDPTNYMDTCDEYTAEPPTNTDSSVFIRILKLITDEKLKNTRTIDARGTQKI